MTLFPATELVPAREPKYEIILEEEHQLEKEEQHEKEKRLSKKERRKKKRFRCVAFSTI